MNNYTISNTQMAEEIKRELAMRKKVYPGLIKSGKLSRTDAVIRYRRLQAALKLIQENILKTNPTNSIPGIW